MTPGWGRFLVGLGWTGFDWLGRAWTGRVEAKSPGENEGVGFVVFGLVMAWG